MLDREPLASFQELERQLGRTNALREWKLYHHADQAIEVAPWPADEFIAIHGAVAQRENDPRRPLPSNRSWLVTETGARLHTGQAFSSQLGWPAPIDPPADHLLRLTWQLKHFEALAKEASHRFAKLKAAAKQRADSGQRDPDDIDRLVGLKSEIENLRSLINEVAEQRDPLLPAALRPPTAEQVAREQECAAQEAAFDKQVDSIEI